MRKTALSRTKTLQKEAGSEAVSLADQIHQWAPVGFVYLLMNRAASAPPLPQVVGTTLLLAASIVAVIWLSGKIFRIGILRTGQPPKLLELVRWVRGG
jgi:xanthosine utilization system XapX-like protein